MTTRLLLVGAGHAHLEVLRSLAARRLPAVQVTLLSPSPQVMYSGMVPGLIAGHYRRDECTIDVAAATTRAGGHFIVGQMRGVDFDRGAVFCDELALRFDLLSFDVGSAPAWSEVLGAAAHAVPVRPLAAFVDQAEELFADLLPQRISVVGGGAASFELALALASRLETAAAGKTIRLSLLTEGNDVLAAFPAAMRRYARRELRRAGIALHAGAQVASVADRELRCADGRRFAFDRLIWATGAAPHGWLSNCGIATVAAGWISVAATLRSVSHPKVFAAGDCAAIAGHELARSGVYAVRQGPLLAENLRRALAGARLRSYVPQRFSLALISTGRRHALAAYGPMAFEGDWVWRWKDRIDRAYVARHHSG